VVSENSIERKSSCIAMIEVEQSTKPLTSLDVSDGAFCGAFGRRRQRKQAVADALVISFQLIVLDVLGNELSEVPLTERNDAGETLTADGADEALSESVEVGAPGRQTHAADAAAEQQFRERSSKHRITVMNHKADPTRDELAKLRRVQIPDCIKRPRVAAEVWRRGSWPVSAARRA